MKFKGKIAVITGASAGMGTNPRSGSPDGLQMLLFSSLPMIPAL